MKFRLWRFTPGISVFRLQTTVNRWEVHTDKGVVWASFAAFGRCLYVWIWNC